MLHTLNYGSGPVTPLCLRGVGPCFWTCFMPYHPGLLGLNGLI
jgi:hypothetical protein